MKLLSVDLLPRLVIVVLIIIGILAAIALPSFLNQSNKAKQSEAKTYVGTLNKGQQAYYTEKSVFGSTIDILGVGVKSSTVNYNYSSTAITSTAVSSNAANSFGTAIPVALRSYVGTVQLNVVSTTSDVTSLAVLCEANAAGGIAPTPALNSSNGPSCSANSVLVGS